MHKIADLSYTKTMPASPPADVKVEPTKAVIKKTGAATMGHLVHDGNPNAKSVYEPEEGPPYHDFIHGSNEQKLPQAKVMKPHVDVSDMQPSAKVTKKEASITALHGKYPLDDFAQVKTASQYFSDYWKMFSPADRHEFAKNLVKRASVLGIEVPDAAREYGSEKCASRARLDVCMDARRSLLVQDEESKHRDLLNKVAAQADKVDPETFAELVHEFDKTAGLDVHYDSDVPDPWTTVFAMEKEAEFTEVLGNIQVGESDLRFLARMRISAVKGVFNEEIAEEFQKDPIGVYKSLPIDQRKILANLARSQSTTGSIS